MNNQQATLIDSLQQLEAGTLHDLVPELREAIEQRFKRNILLMKQHKTISNECTICHTDLQLIHHIWNYHRIRKYNGDNDEELNKKSEILSIIFICPNCHHRVHNLNPYFTK